MFKLPKGETILLTMFNSIEDKDVKYIITRNIYGEYTRYEVIEGQYKKIKKSQNGNDLQ